MGSGQKYWMDLENEEAEQRDREKKKQELAKASDFLQKWMKKKQVERYSDSEILVRVVKGEIEILEKQEPYKHANWNKEK
jgi:hypothetical protein